jgi:hypothetical protein
MACFRHNLARGYAQTVRANQLRLLATDRGFYRMRIDADGRRCARTDSGHRKVTRSWRCGMERYGKLLRKFWRLAGAGVRS